MAMTGAGLAEARKAAMDAIASPNGNSAGDATAYREALLSADSNAIVEYIQANAAATGADSRGDTHNLVIE
jgi:hypothetical protein